MSSILRGGRKLLLAGALGVGGAALAAGFFGFTDDKRSQPSSFFNDYSFFNGSMINGPSTRIYGKWDTNWDKRDPSSLVKPLKGNFNYNVEDENKQNERLEKAKAIATRHLILVRHGQYNLNGSSDLQRSLTQLGRDQAQVTGRRLKQLALPYTRMIQSTMTRATETAQIISNELLSSVPVTSCDFLREGAPFPPEPPISGWKEKNYFDDGARIEAAFRKYFHRADPSQDKDSYEILVCHANVIRYFICRALQLPPEAWLRFSLHNCSLTWVAIRPSGRVTVYAVGDAGHLPPEKMTTT